MADNSKNHHFVPQSFMKAWLPAEEEKFYCYNKQKKSVFRVSPQGVNAVNQLHTIFGRDDETGKEENLKLEHLIHKRENMDMEAMAKLRKADKSAMEHILSEQDRKKDIIEVIARLKLRNPQNFQRTADFLESRKDATYNSEHIKALSASPEQHHKNWAKVAVVMAISSQTLPFFLWKATEGYHIDIRIFQQDLLLCGSSPAEDFEVSDSTVAGTGIFPISPSKAIVFSRAKKEHIEPIMNLPDRQFAYVSNQRAFLNGNFVISSRSDFYGFSLE